MILKLYFNIPEVKMPAWEITPQAIFSDWLAIGVKHYCPDCYELDEETGKYVPKKGDNTE